jgi:tetratricopeptide (TPR) repeat protein
MKKVIMNEQDDPKKTANAGQDSSGGQHEEVKPIDYIREVRSHLQNAKPKDAYSLLQQATVRFPEDPIILSYYGFLQADLNKKLRIGVDICKRAILLGEERGLSSEKAYIPVLYLNLGKALVAADRKKDALDAFRKGLQYDRGNNDLKKEMQVLGVRKQPVVSFLDRSNPINVLLGLLLKPSKKTPSVGKGGKRSR